MTTVFSGFYILLQLAYLVVMALVGYWVIRLAVRHALRDADARRNDTEKD